MTLTITHYPESDEIIVKNPLYNSDNTVTTATTVASNKDHNDSDSIVSSLSDCDNDSLIIPYNSPITAVPPGKRSCLAHAPSSRRSTNRLHLRSDSSVSFGNIQMREYERIPGDHPETSIGVPLSIGWAFREQPLMQVEKYEKQKMDLFLEDDGAICLKSRKPTGGCGGASGNVRRLGAMTRKRLLMDEFNVPLEEICAAEKAVTKFKKQLEKMRKAEAEGIDYEVEDEGKKKGKNKLRSLKKGLLNRCGLRTPSSKQTQVVLVG